MSAEDLSKRERQVFGESIEGTLPPTDDYIVTRMAIQDHHAEKAGRHFDVRFLINGKGVSFVTRKGFPEKVGELRRLVRMPNHKPEYMEWEGRIPSGSYGGGLVQLHDAQDVILKAEPEKMTLDIHNGPNTGRFSIFKHWNDWFMVKKKDFEKNWAERSQYKSIEDPTKIPNYEEYMALQKLDGASFIATVNPHGISYVSAHKSKDGTIISRENSVPHLRDIKLPSKYHGMVVKGELWHPAGFNVLSGILNSKPTNAVIDQQEYGKVMFAPFDIVSMPGEAPVAYSDKLKMLKEMSIASKSKYIGIPQYAIKDKQEFENKMIGNTDEEGMVYRHTSNPEAPIYKLKNYYDYDLRVSGLISGEGKFKNKGIGALRLEDAKGNFVGNVGTGLSDEARKMFFKDPDSILGKVIKVKSMKPLIDKLRAPVYMGISDKTKPDMLKTAAFDEDVMGLKSRDDVERIYQKALETKTVRHMPALVGRILEAAGLGSGGYATTAFPMLNPTVIMPPKGEYPMERQMLGAASNDKSEYSENDVQDMHKVIAMHELAERQSLIDSKHSQRTILPFLGAMIGGIVTPPEFNLGIPFVNRTVGAGLGALAGKLVIKAIRIVHKEHSDLAKDSKQLDYAGESLVSAHHDPSVLLTESNAVVAMNNPIVAKAMKIMRATTGEKYPLMEATDFGYGNRHIDPRDTTIRNKIFQQYEDNYSIRKFVRGINKVRKALSWSHDREE